MIIQIEGLRIKAILVSIMTISACSSEPKVDESSYKYTIFDSKGIISVVSDKAARCKGAAKFDRYEAAKSCNLELYELSKKGTKYHTAAADILDRAMKDKTKEKDRDYLKIMKDIEYVGETQGYLVSYLKSAE